MPSLAWNLQAVKFNSLPEIVKRLSAEVAAVVRMEEVKKAFDDLGIVPVGNTPAEFDAFIVGEMDKWGKVIRDAKVKAE